MKKTLFAALIALSSAASVVLGKTVSIDTTYDNEASTTEYSAFAVDFSKTAHFSEAPPINSQDLTLASVTLLNAPEAADTKLAVYIATPEVYPSGYTDYVWSEFVGFSEAAYVSGSKATYALTLDFNLSENTSYAFAFVAKETEESSINKGTELWKTFYIDANADMLIEVSAGELNDDNAFIMYGAGFGNVYNHIPVAAFTFSDGSPETSAVPEPATATLSLLALASLAARRRRK